MLSLKSACLASKKICVQFTEPIQQIRVWQHALGNPALERQTAGIPEAGWIGSRGYKVNYRPTRPCLKHTKHAAEMAQL